MSDHPTEALLAAALDPAEHRLVLDHAACCPSCGAELARWRHLTERLADLPAPRPSASLVALTVSTVEGRLVERAERRWNRAALAFAVAFAWTLTVSSWLLADLLHGELALRLGTSIGPAAAWYAGYVAMGWLTAGVAASLLGRAPREEGRAS